LSFGACILLFAAYAFFNSTGLSGLVESIL